MFLFSAVLVELGALCTVQRAHSLKFSSRRVPVGVIGIPGE